MTTAFVLSGGASLGAVQVGMLGALADAGIRPDLLLGTSVGALNAGWIASDPGPASVERLDAVWRSLRGRDVFPPDPLGGFLGFFGRRDHLVPSGALRRLVRRHLRFERLEDAPIPLHTVATDLHTGRDVRLSSGPAVDAVIASAAIPGVFPPVVVDGRHLIDGGVVNNAPISHAVELGADTVYVLSTGYACDLHEVPRTALGVALQAVTLMVQTRLALDVERYEHEVDLRVVPPPCPITVSPADFDQSETLLAQGRTLAEQWLAGEHRFEHQAVALRPHRHT